MTYARSHLIDPEGGVYHVCSRCVRRAFLCGADKKLGYDFDHRRVWIEERILELSQIFSIDILGYAVMSNHYHIVLQVTPDDAGKWTNHEVAEKWLALNPRANETSEAQKSRAQAIANDDERLKIIRGRLSSLSWFMRFLNEPLARLANKEDDCKGRFWEGRFKSQRLLDEDAILACMVYVDLNPVRAKISDDATTAKHTSLAKRLKMSENISDSLQIISKPTSLMPISLTLSDYIQLVQWTEQSQQNERPTNVENTSKFQLEIKQSMPKPGYWQRALGSKQSLRQYATQLGQLWIRTSPA
jgi:REP element-mobilizing transposase RayT